LFEVTVRFTQQVSAERKHQTAGDVPLPIVMGVVVVMVAGFVPHIVAGPTLPERLPTVSLDPIANSAAHRAARRRAPPAFVEQAFDRLGQASARRDSAATAVAARDFAEALVEGAGDDDSARAAMRESMTDRFITNLLGVASQRGPSPCAAPTSQQREGRQGFACVALRHRIVPAGRAPSERELSIARAWFGFRWEALGARASLRGEHVALDTILQKLLPEDRRALVAWVLDADCTALLGAEPYAQLSRAQLQRCSSARVEFASVAPAIERGFDRAEALATIDALEGRALLALSRTVSDPAASAVLTTAARDALARAHGRYLALAARGADRTIQRYLLATDQAAQPR
jgi:hypothetical protein